MSILIENNVNLVKITGYIEGEGTVTKSFTNIGRDSVAWNETVWGGSLTRTNTFALENIDDVEIGQVPQLTLVFKYMKMDDFITLQKLLKQRHLIVEYFDYDKGHTVKHEMAITGNERKKFYSYQNYLDGVIDFTIKMVGTNRKVPNTDDYESGIDLTISYNGNGADSGSDKVENHQITDQITIDNGSGYSKSGYHLKEWNTKSDGTGQTYQPNFSMTLWQSLVLYAIWEA